MTDRELLERAARAAYYHYDPDEGVCGTLYVDKYARRQHGWNPLEDDADAFRLMVDCGLTVCADGERTVSASEAWDPGGVFVTQSINGDKRESTRRAIVRAAAEMGEP